MNETVEKNRNGEVSWQRTTELLGDGIEKDATVTIVLVVIGVVAAIVLLFSMGIFIDCRHRGKTGAGVKRLLRLKMQTPSAATCRRNVTEDGKSLASNMCNNAGDNDLGNRATNFYGADSSPV